MMTDERFVIGVESEFQENAVFKGDEFICFEDDSESLVDLLNKKERQIELLNDELEQCKAVINNRWSEYLKKKGVIDDD